MSNYITLLGAEDVRRAASTISSAASDIRHAAAVFDGAVTAQRLNLNDFITQFESLVERLEKLHEKSPS